MYVSVIEKVDEFDLSVCLFIVRNLKLLWILGVLIWWLVNGWIFGFWGFIIY